MGRAVESDIYWCLVWLACRAVIRVALHYTIDHGGAAVRHD